MEEILQRFGVGIRPVNDAFFDDSYKACKTFQRKGVTIDDEEELCHEAIREFPCYVSGCKTTFKTLLDYEMHYNSSHRYACLECKISKQSPRLLEIHVQETHDAFFKVLSEKQPMYQCYDSECNIKFDNPMERKQHCIKVHKFPKKYRFDDVTHSKKKSKSNKMEVDNSENEKKTNKVIFNKNQKSKMFTKAAANPVCENKCSADTIPASTIKTSTTSLVFIPRQVQKSFSKVLTNNQSKERNVLETETMMELADSLPD